MGEERGKNTTGLMGEKDGEGGGEALVGDEDTWAGSLRAEGEARAPGAEGVVQVSRADGVETGTEASGKASTDGEGEKLSKLIGTKGGRCSSAASGSL